MMPWRLYDLRYGENPHQLGAFYADAHSPLPQTNLSVDPEALLAELGRRMGIVGGTREAPYPDQRRAPVLSPRAFV